MRFFFGFLEQLLEFGLQHFRFILFCFDDLLIFFVAAAGFFLDKLGGVFQFGDQLRLGRQLVFEDDGQGRIDGQHRIAARAGDLDRGFVFVLDISYLLRHGCVSSISRHDRVTLSSQFDLLPVRATEDDPAPAVFSRFAGGGIMGRADQLTPSS